MRKLQIEIVKWGDYNPRKDLVTMTWFRVQSAIATDPKMFQLTVGGRWLWITLLSLAAQDKNATINCMLNYLAHISGVPEKEVLEQLQILEENQMVQITDGSVTGHDRCADGNVPYITEQNVQNSTEQNKGIIERAKRTRFDAQTLLDVLDRLPKETIAHWVEMYPDKPYRDRILKKAFHYYSQQHPRKKPKTVQGWSSKFGYWLDKDWSKGADNRRTFAQMKSDNNADLVRRAREGEFDEYEN